MFNSPYNQNYNNAYGVGYSNYPQQNYNQVTQQQMQQAQQANAVNTNKIFVNGIDDVKSRIQPPNSDMLYLDNEKPLLYQKIVDGTGKFTVNTFTIAEFAENKPEKAQNIDMGEYVLKSEFNALQAQINDLQKSFSELKKCKVDNFLPTEVKK